MKVATTAPRGEWLKARLALLEREKAYSRERDALNKSRQALPWVKIEKAYTFDAPSGRETLADLFGDRDQLIVYHFMFDPEWDAGCKSCSFLADHFNPSIVHLAARNVAMVAVSKAPLEKLKAFKKRMGWDFKWVSSAYNDFNRDFGVSFTDDEMEGEAFYNFGTQQFPVREAPGASVFARGDDGALYHTYSVYSRGLERFMGAYDWLDISPKGRDEDGLAYGMEWLRLKDSYED